MEEVRNKSDDKKLLILAILFILFEAVGLVIWGVQGIFSLYWTAEIVIMAVVAFMLYHSYRTHNKNITKPLLGATLIWMMLYELG